MKLTGSTTLNFPLVFVLLFNMYSKIEIQMVFWPEVLLYLLAVWEKLKENSFGILVDPQSRNGRKSESASL